MLKGKKAEITDIIVLVVLAFFLAISFLVVAYVNTKFKDVIQNTALNETETAQLAIAGLDNMNVNSIQNGFVMIFAFLIIGIIASSFMIKYHPIFLFIFLIFGAVGIFLAAILGNVYNEFINVAELSVVAAQQTRITWIMQHIVGIMVGVFGLGMVVLFARIPNSGGGQF